MLSFTDRELQILIEIATQLPPDRRAVYLEAVAEAVAGTVYELAPLEPRSEQPIEFNASDQVTTARMAVP